MADEQRRCSGCWSSSSSSSSSSYSSSVKLLLLMVPLIVVAGLVSVLGTPKTSSSTLVNLQNYPSSSSSSSSSRIDGLNDSYTKEGEGLRARMAMVGVEDNNKEEALVTDDEADLLNLTSLPPITAEEDVEAQQSLNNSINKDGLLNISTAEAPRNGMADEMKNESDHVIPIKEKQRVITKLERLEAGLQRARVAIREAAIGDSDDGDDGGHGQPQDPDFTPLGPMYWDSKAFYRSYLEMEKQFKVFVYEEGEPPVFHDGPCKSIYSMEGNFIYTMEINRQFQTKDPDSAHVFFLPFSVAKMVRFVYVRDSHDFSPIKRTVVDYVNLIARRYPYWNRSLGADHFMVACHDWGPETSFSLPYLHKNSIRALCNANTSEKFNPMKDVSFPEINLLTGELKGLVGGPSPSKRPFLAFFAGGVHGPMAKSGFTSVWLPPATNSFSPEGYLPQNLYSLNSAYGSERLLKALLYKMKQHKVRAMADIVINHRVGTIRGHKGMYNRYDGIPLSWDEKAVTSCTGGLGNRSTGDNFNGVPNIDHTQPFVRKDIIAWLQWLRNNVGFLDFRFDFARGYSAKYVKEYVEGAKPIFSVGEYWDSCNYNGRSLDYNQDSHRQRIINWIDGTGQMSTAFDFTTKGILQEAVKGQFWRLRDSKGKPPGVMGWWPSRAVTFIDNHDTGSTQAHWPFPSNHIMEGYAYILTHPGIPTVFYDHFYDWGNSCHDQIVELMDVRRRQDIHSRSSIRILEAQPNLYSAIIGENVCMKIGEGSWCPTGQEWTLATSGHRYAVWQK